MRVVSKHSYGSCVVAPLKCGRGQSLSVSSRFSGLCALHRETRAQCELLARGCVSVWMHFIVLGICL